MNMERRKEIEKIVVEVECSIEDLRRRHSDYYPSLGRVFAPLTQQLETVRDEEAESLQSVPMGFRSGFRGEVAKERLQYLNLALAISEGLEAEAFDEAEISCYLGNLVTALEKATA